MASSDSLIDTQHSQRDYSRFTLVVTRRILENRSLMHYIYHILGSEHYRAVNAVLRLLRALVLTSRTCARLVFHSFDVAFKVHLFIFFPQQNTHTHTHTHAHTHTHTHRESISPLFRNLNSIQICCVTLRFIETCMICVCACVRVCVCVCVVGRVICRHSRDLQKNDNNPKIIKLRIGNLMCGRGWCGLVSPSCRVVTRHSFAKCCYCTALIPLQQQRATERISRLPTPRPHQRLPRKKRKLFGNTCSQDWRTIHRLSSPRFSPHGSLTSSHSLISHAN
jgi:hypothetical protein